jgi:hypothetical protein
MVIDDDDWFAARLNRLLETAQLLQRVRVDCEDGVIVNRPCVVYDFEGQLR